MLSFILSVALAGEYDGCIPKTNQQVKMLKDLCFKVTDEMRKKQKNINKQDPNLKLIKP